MESIVSGDITTFLSEDVFEAAERLSAMLSDRRDTTGNSNGETVETIM
ncbi:MAG TPA: hypothetical protein PK765_01815 [bacterium]|nr:hypothetical protein [bacterium]